MTCQYRGAWLSDNQGDGVVFNKRATAWSMALQVISGITDSWFDSSPCPVQPCLICLGKEHYQDSDSTISRRIPDSPMSNEMSIDSCRDFYTIVSHLGQTDPPFIFHRKWIILQNQNKQTKTNWIMHFNILNEKSKGGGFHNFLLSLQYRNTYHKCNRPRDRLCNETGLRFRTRTYFPVTTVPLLYINMKPHETRLETVPGQCSRA